MSAVNEKCFLGAGSTTRQITCKIELTYILIYHLINQFSLSQKSLSSLTQTSHLTIFNPKVLSQTSWTVETQGRNPQSSWLRPEVSVMRPRCCGCLRRRETRRRPWNCTASAAPWYAPLRRVGCAEQCSNDIPVDGECWGKKLNFMVIFVMSTITCETACIVELLADNRHVWCGLVDPHSRLTNLTMCPLLFVQPGVLRAGMQLLPEKEKKHGRTVLVNAETRVSVWG